MITILLALTLAVRAIDVPALPPTSWQAEAAPAYQAPPFSVTTFTAAAPRCHVIADTTPWGITPIEGQLPWRYIEVAVTPDCPPEGEARVGLAGYGFRKPGAPVIIKPGQKIRFGPVPPYRRLLWYSATDVPFDVPLGERERRERGQAP